MEKNLGYWRVGDTLFNNKVNAILEAQKTQKEVSYHYNDVWWDQVDWTQEPSESLGQLYAKRARQLRDTYKTVVVKFSGGADSTNMIRTFLDNGIKIDYVVMSMMQDIIYQDVSTHPANLERFKVAIPALEKFQQQGADFKIIIADISRFLLDIGDDPNWIFRINAPRFDIATILNPRAVKHEIFKEIDHPSTCVIQGVDKPQILVHRGKIWTFQVCDRHAPMNDQHTNMINEPFYWTADLPELLVKQAHCIKNYFQNRPENIPVEADSYGHVWDKKDIVPLIYPDYNNFAPGDPLPYWDPHTDGHSFLKKNNEPRYCGVDAEIEKTPVYDAWCKGIDLADHLIERRYKTEDSIWTAGLVTMYSKPRWLGK
jgi:hypothetical protein